MDEQSAFFLDCGGDDAAHSGQSRRAPRKNALDFGIAKILSSGTENVAEATVTRPGMMTPQFASPEQARGAKS